MIFKCWAPSCNMSEFVLEKVKQDDEKPAIDELSIKNIIASTMFDSDEIDGTHHQPYLTKKNDDDNFETVEFLESYIGRNIFVKGHMGTGKTEWLMHVIRQYFNDKYIVLLSSRKSYTDSFCMRIGATNYQDSTKLELNQNTPMICVQLESIN